MWQFCEREADQALRGLHEIGCSHEQSSLKSKDWAVLFHMTCQESTQSLIAKKRKAEDVVTAESEVAAVTPAPKRGGKKRKAEPVVEAPVSKKKRRGRK